MDVRFKIAADGTSLDDTGLKYDINDFDAWAVEAALQLKEKPARVKWSCSRSDLMPLPKRIRKALSMGADRGNSPQDRSHSFRRLCNRIALAAELKDGGYDLIFFGKMSPDSSNGIVGPIVAEIAGTALRHSDFEAGYRRWKGNSEARARGRTGNRRVSASGCSHSRRRTQHRAISLAQGDHGRQEEAARGKARDARRTRSLGAETGAASGASCRDESSAKGRRQFPI